MGIALLELVILGFLSVSGQKLASAVFTGRPGTADSLEEHHWQWHENGHE